VFVYFVIPGILGIVGEYLVAPESLSKQAQIPTWEVTGMIDPAPKEIEPPV
jgi:hypothetical protein